MISTNKFFINKYNWNGIKYPSKLDDWKEFEKNIPTIALNILYIKETKYTLLIFQNITQPVIKQIILLMTPNKEIAEWYYLAVKIYLLYYKE